MENENSCFNPKSKQTTYFQDILRLDMRWRRHGGRCNKRRLGIISIGHRRHTSLVDGRTSTRDRRKSSRKCATEAGQRESTAEIPYLNDAATRRSARTGGRGGVGGCARARKKPTHAKLLPFPVWVKRSHHVRSTIKAGNAQTLLS